MVEVIIVEGLDNTGKTTLVEKIIAGYPELRFVPSIGNKHDLKVIYDQANEALTDDLDDPLVVWDRSRFISEYVYNPVLRNREFAYDASTWLHMLSRYVSQPQLIIHCRRPLNSILETFSARQQLEGVVKLLPQLDAAYEEVMGFLGYVFSTQQNASQIITYDFEESMDESYVWYAVNNYLEVVS